MPPITAASWAFGVDLFMSAALRAVTQANSTSAVVAGVSVVMCLVEVFSRYISVDRVKQELEKTFSQANFKESRFLQRRSVVAAAVVPLRRADRNQAMRTANKKKTDHADLVIVLYNENMAANILAEHVAMWMILAHLAMGTIYPHLIHGENNASMNKIGLDFVIQLFFEMIADIASIWLAYKVVGMSPLEVFKMKEHKALWGSFFGFTLLVACYQFWPINECAACSVWNAEACLGPE